MHGYLIAKIIGKMIGPFRQVQWGALYPVLNRLEAGGLIRAEAQVEADEGRARKVYAITGSGRAHLRELLLDTEHHLGDYPAVFTQKVPFMHLLEPHERVRLCRHYAVYAQQHLDHLRRSHREVQLPDARLCEVEREGIITVIDHTLDRWDLERQWAERLITQYSQEVAS